MIYSILVEAAIKGELILVRNGMCRWHRRRDGVVVIREIIVLPDKRLKGIGLRMVQVVIRKNLSSTIRAVCPKNNRSNSFWQHIGFKLVGETKDLNTWEKPSTLN